MITRLNLQNFQSHKNTSIEFAPGVNTIIGQSDSGKTAIIRALRYAISNRPLGDAFIRHGEDQSVVMVGLKNGKDDVVVERAKGKNDYYRLHTSEDVLEFKAFGTDVPEEINTAFNLSDINVQGQMDSAFLLSDNSGEVSRHFNKIANIEKIDSSLKAVERWIRSLKQDVRSTEEQLEEFEQQASELDYLDKLEADVEAAESLEARKNKIASDAQKLEKLIYNIESTSSEIDEIAPDLDIAPTVDEAIALYNKLEELLKDFKTVKDLGVLIVDVAKQIKTKKAYISKETLVKETITLTDKLNEANDKMLSLDSLLNHVESIDIKLADLQLKVEADTETLASEMPDICPLCDQPIT